jgi:D-alanyl-D-alanine carboxypeptidase/D-alanyl-D-alanine-endopeptidase (penicillin-binding protein 4)
MMHESDNLFAEQSLLMVSNEVLGVMDDVKIIDTLLKTDFADLPQKPRWVDGSGLSRYNLFTPKDFVVILHKMQTALAWTGSGACFLPVAKGLLKGISGATVQSFLPKPARSPA